jgi:predicted N-acetyltransferase YhbS
MNIEELHAAAKANLAETYLSLGSATGCAQMLDGPDVVGCIGEFPHPMCNFALLSDGPKSAVEELREVAIHHPGFHVYLCTAKGERCSGGALTKAGFRQVHALVQMASPAAKEQERMPLALASSPDDRRQVARFMMSQFFSRHPDWIKERVCEATATAGGLELYAMHAGRGFIGAVMLRPSQKSIGLYNLCVAGMKRSQGHGSSIVQAVKRHAAVFGVPVILQCADELERWYRSLGFAAIGQMDVYALPPSIRA